MMQLLPGDRLWNRFEVEHGAGAMPESVLLRPCVEGVTVDTAKRWLLIPLDRAERDPLIKLLADLGSHWRLNAAISSRSTRKKTIKASATAYGATLNLTLLPQTEWIGDPAHGGVVLLPLLPAKPLHALLKSAGALSAAQVLPLAIEISAGLQQIFAACKESGSTPVLEQSLFALPWLSTPDSILLRTDNAEPAMRAERGGSNWAEKIRPPAWADFIAPEIFETPGDARKIPAALVFAAARLTTYLLGMESFAAPGAANWTAFAKWANGKHDASGEWLAHPSAASLPPELRELLSRALSLKPAHRPATLETFGTALRAFSDQAWARPEAHCTRCGFVLNSASPCPCCGEAARIVEPVEPPARAGSKGNTTAILRARSTIPAPPGMTLIEAGSFLSGEDKLPRTLRAFAIDTFPVSEGNYKKFLAELQRKARIDGPGSRGPEYDRHPVTRITWYEANEFAEHHTKRLPTVFEWEKAARGSDGRKFPFGNTFKGRIGQMRLVDEGGRRHDEGGTTAVGTYPAAASPYGVMDMAGNVLEWTTSARRAGERLFRAVKGSCYKDGSPELARCTSVQYLPPESSEPHIGFRCVKDVE